MSQPTATIETDRDERFYAAAAQAGLSQLEQDVALMWIDGAPINKICRALSLQRTMVFLILDDATKLLAQNCPEFWDEGHAFPRELVRAIKNQPDQRGELSGVAPAYDVATHLPRVQAFSGDRKELRQSRRDCLRHWGRGLAPDQSGLAGTPA